MGTVAILDPAARKIATTDTPIPVVYASSAAIYGENPNQPLTETAQLQPISTYGSTCSPVSNARVVTKVHSIPP